MAMASARQSRDGAAQLARASTPVRIGRQKFALERQLAGALSTTGDQPLDDQAVTARRVRSSQRTIHFASTRACRQETATLCLRSWARSPLQ